MQSTLTAIRLISARYAKRTIRLIGIISCIVVAILIAATWLLAHFLSAWWWLLLILIIPVGIIVLLALAVAYLLTSLVFRRRLTKEQRILADELIDKLQSITEKTGWSFYFIVFVVCKDLLVHRDLRTLQEFIHDSVSLKKDIDTLARTF